MFSILSKASWLFLFPQELILIRIVSPMLSEMNPTICPSPTQKIYPLKETKVSSRCLWKSLQPLRYRALSKPEC